MFKKKSEPPKEEPKKEKRKPLFYQSPVIKAAIEILEDAVATGQISSRYLGQERQVRSYYTGSEITKLGLCFIGPTPDAYHSGYVVYGSETFESLTIKGIEELQAEDKAKKEAELAKAKECLAKDLATVEQLSKELGSGVPA